MMDKPTYIELTAEIADKMVNIAMSENGKQVYENVANGSVVYTPTAQIMFNNYLDDVCQIFDGCGIEGND
jgi:hypothetical protein